MYSKRNSGKRKKKTNITLSQKKLIEGHNWQIKNQNRIMNPMPKVCLILVQQVGMIIF
jgi:uncharacterized membrane protein